MRALWRAGKYEGGLRATADERLCGNGDPGRMPRHDPFRLVIAGGGVAALEALVALRSVRTRITVTLLCDIESFSYRSLATGEAFGLGTPHRYDLAELCEDLDARFVRGCVRAVDADAHVVQTAAGDMLPYDALIVAMGAEAHPAFEHGVTFDREHTPHEFDEALSDLRAGFAPDVAIVVPPGASWTLPAYELAFLTAAWGRREGVGVTLVTPEKSPLAAFGPTASAGVARLLADERIDLRPGAHAQILSDTALRAGSTWVEASRIVSLPLLRGLRVVGLPHDGQGFLPVDELCGVIGCDDVWAAGDGTARPVKQGGLAAQQADLAARAVLHRAGEPTRPEPYRPVLRGLLRTSTTPHYLRAELDRVAETSQISQQPLWWPPSKIAACWLPSYLARQDASRITAPEQPAATDPIAA